MDYIINPTRMGGIISDIGDEMIKINLHGRLGVIYAKLVLLEGDSAPEKDQDIRFYFSYIQVVKDALDYDMKELLSAGHVDPVLVGGKIVEVNDTAIKVEIKNNIGTVAVPRRWVFTDVEPRIGMNTEFYLSRMQIVV